MQKRDLQSTSTPTDTVSARLPTDEIGRLDTLASAAGFTRSEYIKAILRGRMPELDPALSALGHLIAIRASVVRHGTLSADELQRLEQLVLRLTQGGTPSFDGARSA